LSEGVASRSHRRLPIAYPDPAEPFEASVQTLAQLQAEGKIRFVGLSNVTKEHIERARKIVPIVSVQNRYSFPIVNGIMS
jgi:aryl-alcohol dehydrogenase-like predicted oxidoreductase